MNNGTCAISEKSDCPTNDQDYSNYIKYTIHGVFFILFRIQRIGVMDLLHYKDEWIA
jgi:hypothetical protein